MSAVIFIPCYNCEKQILKTLNSVNDMLNTAGTSSVTKIWVVDNKSDDKTFEIASEFAKNKIHFEVYKNEKNLGLGGSFKKYFIKGAESDFENFILFHGDNQGDARDIARLLRSAESRKDLSAVLGSRFSAESKLKNYSTIRKTGNVILNKLMTVLGGVPIADLGSGLNVYNLKLIDTKFVSALPDHVAFDLFLLFYIIDKKLPFQFVPIHWKSEGESSTINPWSVGWFLLKEIFNWKLKSLCRWPGKDPASRDSVTRRNR